MTRLDGCVKLKNYLNFFKTITFNLYTTVGKVIREIVNLVKKIKFFTDSAMLIHL